MRVAADYVDAGWFARLPAAAGAWGYFGVLWLGALLLTVGASAATYHFIEKPGITLGNAIIRRLADTARTPATVPDPAVTLPPTA